MNSKKQSAKKSDSKEPAQPRLDLRREEDFTLKYANHIATEPNGWDVKLIFGRVDLSAGPNVVFQHSAVSLPWPTVKSLIYLLQLQLIAYEGTNGHVPFPWGGILEVPRSLPDKLARSVPNAEAIHGRILKLYDEFMAANPEAAQNK